MTFLFFGRPSLDGGATIGTQNIQERRGTPLAEGRAIRPSLQRGTLAVTLMRTSESLVGNKSPNLPLSTSGIACQPKGLVID
jgi:hypothetical protein